MSRVSQKLALPAALLAVLCMGGPGVSAEPSRQSVALKIVESEPRPVSESDPAAEEADELEPDELQPDDDGIVSADEGEDVHEPRILEPDEEVDLEPTPTVAPPPAVDEDALREMADPAGDFFHQGHFQHKDEQGRVAAEGDYVEGKRSGPWTRWLVAGEGEIFAGPPYDEFTRPFLSQATFENGKIKGAWTVCDRDGRPIGTWQLDAAGRPHGVCQWWYPSGVKMREVQFEHGVVHGKFREWNPEGAVLVAENYHAGRKLVTNTKWAHPGQKRSEGTELLPGQVEECTCDWWKAAVQREVVAEYDTQDRQGAWTWWYDDGAMRLQATYAAGVEQGKFTWWYPNSQKRIEGHYEHGEQSGKWTWYHANGMKQLTGRYAAGEKIARWAGYDENGTLVEDETFGGLKSLPHEKNEDVASEEPANSAEPEIEGDGSIIPEAPVESASKDRPVER